MSSSESRKWLVFGSTGWIGGQIIELLSNKEKLLSSSTVPKEYWIKINDDPVDYIEVVAAKSRLDDVSAMEQEIDAVKPHRVFNCAGLTGRPNVDWCEDHQKEVIRVNVIGTLALTDICAKRTIHITHMATGCIYSYDAQHPLGSGIGFTETDPPNFQGSFYSRTKGYVDQLFSSYDNVLVLRLRMPISGDLHPRSFVTKISQYPKVVNIPNSMSVLPDLLPVGINMAYRGLTGTFNYVNPGVISHNQVLDLYIKYVNPKFVYTNFTEEEQSKILKAGRSNNELDCTKLLKLYPDIPHILEAVETQMKAVNK